MFWCLRRNVEPCCHTHDSRTTMNVYSAKPRLVGLSLYTVTDNRDCVQRVALGRPIPAVNRKPVAKCKIQTRVQQLFQCAEVFRLPVHESGMTFHLVYDSLDCHLWLSDDNWRLICSVTHRQTHTPHDSIGGACIALRGKNSSLVYTGRAATLLCSAIQQNK